MQSIFSTALSWAVAKHIDLSVTRRETLSWLTLLIMQHGTICLWRLAAYVASMAQTDSVRRRFYRFFQFVRLDSALAAHVVVELLGLGGKPWVMAIDPDKLGFWQDHDQHPDDLGDMERHGHSAAVDAAANGWKLTHVGADRAS